MKWDTALQRLTEVQAGMVVEAGKAATEKIKEKRALQRLT